MVNLKRSVYQYIIIAVFLIMISGCAINPVTGGANLALITEKQEIDLGNKFHQEILKQYDIYDDQKLQDYIKNIGAKLAEKSHRSSLVYRFYVLDSDEINAFALPGGYIYITRGIIAYLASEAELASVLAHEIGHVTARHSVRQYSAQQLSNIGLVLGRVLLPSVSNVVTDQLTGLFSVALLRGYGRQHELEADRLGAVYLARTGYSPEAMLDVIRILKGQELFEVERATLEGREPRVYHGLFATHPDNDSRLKEVISYAEPLFTEDAIDNEQPFFQYIDGLVYGHNEQQGVWRDNHFYHGPLGFSFTAPERWSYNNYPDRLEMHAPEGKAILILYSKPISKHIKPREFIADELGIAEIENGKEFSTEDGLIGYAGVDPKNTQYVSVIYLEDQAYIMVGKSETLLSFQPIFDKSVRSFHRLTSAEADLAKPLQLKVICANERTQFADLSQQSPFNLLAEERLRLINGLFPDGEPEPGQYLKTIE